MSIFPFSVCAFCILRNPSLLWYHQYSTLYFLWTVLSFVFYTLKLSECYFGVGFNVEIYFFSHLDSQLIQDNLTNSPSFPTDLYHFCDTPSSHIFKGLISRSSIVSQWFIYLPMCQEYTALITLDPESKYSGIFPLQICYGFSWAFTLPLRILRTACKFP